MEVYIVQDKYVKNYTKEKGSICIIPIMSKKGYFLTTNLVELWPELDWKSLEKIELLETDLIKYEI